MDLSLSGKKAVVCGSTQGIGRAAAEELALLGAEIILVARNEEKLRETIASLPVVAEIQHSYIVADFNDPASLGDRIQTFIATNGPCHILVNNTGGPPGGPIVSARLEEFESAFRNHLMCNHVLATTLLPGMMEARYGRIINVISTSVKQPLKGLGVSNTIRAAVANWSKTLSGEVAIHGITVNNVLPGATKTQRLESIISGKAGKTGVDVSSVEEEMIHEIPAGRFADPSETAAAIAFLASPAAAYINGINLPVDGGRTGCL
jgi:3-oxoacyl-[acyl-carrier protein] reductase